MLQGLYDVKLILTLPLLRRDSYNGVGSVCLNELTPLQTVLVFSKFRLVTL